MRHLFWRINFLLLSGATNSTQMYHEAAALATEISPAWSYRSQELMTLYSKAKQYEAGEKVSFGGKEFSPLYTPKNDTLINLFQITDEEQRQLKTIISKNEALERRRARDRKRDEERRRAAGAVERDVYEANSLTKQKPWEALGMSRAKWYRLGKPSGSETTPSPITCHGQMAAKSA
ncbi:TPA: replication protein [Klebsiella pneumoniae]|nr:replication protein [Escherichia coli]HBT1831525.1 replication protein [Klebsiella pneumoniae]